MALKGDRHILYDDIRYFCNQVTERGVVLMFSGNGGSGVDFNNTAMVVMLPSSNASGSVAAGLLLNDMVNVDLTKYHLNFSKDEMQIGSKCHLLKKGWVYTDKITGTPAAGNAAYLAATGNVTPTQDTTTGSLVGKFTGKKDQNGFVGLEVDV